jgi:hypothetical protein
VEPRLAAIPVLLGVVLLGLPGTVRAADIHFTFGIRRPIEACEEAGALIRYRSDG